MGIGQENVSSVPVLPIRPMTIQKTVAHGGFERTVAPGFTCFLVAGVIRSAFGIDVAGECDPLAVGGPDWIGNSCRYVGETCGLPAVQWHPVEIRASVTRAGEQQRLSIRREARRTFSLCTIGQLS